MGIKYQERVAITIILSFLNGKTLPKKCLYSKFFWPVFSCVWTEYRDLHSKSPCSVQMGECTDWKTPNTDIFHAVGVKGKTRTNGK